MGVDSSIQGDGAEDPRRILRSAALLSLLIGLFGMLGRSEIHRAGLDRPSASNIYFRLYSLYELPYLALVALFAGATLLLTFRSVRSDEGFKGLPRYEPPQWSRIGAVACAVFVLGVATTYLVMHQTLFSMDEFGADFQARLFARGQYRANLPWPWRSVGVALAPVFVGFDAQTGNWFSQYVPGYALLKTPFVMAGVSSLLNPMLAAASIVVLAAVARRIWPDEGLRPWVAVALLATSSQVIVTAGTGYSMPGHLFLNLLWLWLYLRGDRRSWAAALLVGVLALWLHNPFPHALFVTPFLLRLLRERRWRRLASASLVYLLSGLLGLAWLRYVNPVVRGADGGLASVFGVPGFFAFLLHVLNVSLVLTWHAPMFGILVLMGLAVRRTSKPVLTDLALGVLLTLGFYLFFPGTQGHGWGYRYAFQVLGSLALIAAEGTPVLWSVLGQRRARAWLVAGLLLAVFVQLPMRLRDTERFVRPFAAAYRYVRSRDAAVVVVRGDSIWYGRDLVRNDPFLQRPIVVKASRLTPGSVEAMKRAFPGKVLEIPDGDFLRLGMTMYVHHE
jgi:hypothetical protein